AGFVDGIGQGMERASQPAVGLGATAAYGAGDVLKMGICHYRAADAADYVRETGGAGFHTGYDGRTVRNGADR
ncbi:hypothetical protein, partial [Escherichia coli]